MFSFSLTFSEIKKALCHRCVCVLTQSCLTLCNHMGYSPPASLSMEFSKQEYWNSLTFLTLEVLSNPGIETD